MKYYLYILKTVDDKLYCGIALDVIKRFKQHLNKKGAKYTCVHKPEKIVYVEIFEDKSSALKEEYKIKKTFSRIEKLALIEKNKTKTQEILKNLSELD